MKILNRILLDPAPAAGGGGSAPAATVITTPAAVTGSAPAAAPAATIVPAKGVTVTTETWRDTLPDDLKGNPLIGAIPDVATLTKGYISAQTMIGAKRIALPGEKATPEEMNEFYKAIGRPESQEKYSPPSVAFDPKLNIDAAGIKEAQGVFFGLGLTDAQQKGIMDFYATGINKTAGGMVQNAEAARAAADLQLQKDWGTEYTANLQIAKAALNKFATPGAMNELEAGLGNNPELIKMFHAMGKAMLEDKSPTGTFKIDNTSVAGAQQRIAELKSDTKFQEALNSNQHPGHADAVALWQQVHRQATPVNSIVR